RGISGLAVSPSMRGVLSCVSFSRVFASRFRAGIQPGSSCSKLLLSTCRWRPPVEGYPQPVGKLLGLGQKPTPEANGYGVGSRPRLQLRQQMADVRLDRLFG